MSTNSVAYRRLYIVLLAVLALGLVGYLREEFSGLPWGQVLFLTLLAMGAEALPVQLPGRTNLGWVSISFAIISAATVVHGPAVGMLVAAIGSISVPELRQSNIWTFVFNRAQLALSAGVSGLAFRAMGGYTGGFNLAEHWFAFLVAGVVYWALNASLLVILMAIRSQTSLLQAARENLGSGFILANLLALTPIAFLLAIVQTSVGWAGVLFFMVPLLAARQAFQMYTDMRESYLSTVQSLAVALEAKDPYTAGHAERVSSLAAQIGKELKLPETELENLRYASILHDIGKIGVRDQILNKPGRYTDEEFAEMKEHTVVGGRILSGVKFLRRVASWVRHHHERWDGKGYPDGLKGEEIPLGARIIAVADAFDAMTSERPYKPAISFEAAQLEIEQNAGHRYDPQVVAAFMSIVSRPGFVEAFQASKEAAAAGEAQVPPGDVPLPAQEKSGLEKLLEGLPLGGLFLALHAGLSRLFGRLVE